MVLEDLEWWLTQVRVWVEDDLHKQLQVVLKEQKNPYLTQQKRWFVRQKSDFINEEKLVHQQVVVEAP